MPGRNTAANSSVRQGRRPVVPAQRRRRTRPLPLPDARAVLGPYWPGLRFWRAVLDDPDWWPTCNLPPAPVRILIDGRGTIRKPASWTIDHASCPFPRPPACDRYYPQAWHARPHSESCPQGSNRRLGVVT